MAHRMAWIARFGTGDGEKILHLNVGSGWKPYTEFRMFCVPEHYVPDLRSHGKSKPLGFSKGWATMQRCRNLGFEMVNSADATGELNQQSQEAKNAS